MYKAIDAFIIFNDACVIFSKVGIIYVYICLNKNN